MKTDWKCESFYILELIIHGFQGQNGVLELSLQNHGDIFEVIILCLRSFHYQCFHHQISPPIIKQSGQFIISVKNNKKLDAEQRRKLEFKVVYVVGDPYRL